MFCRLRRPVAGADMLFIVTPDDRCHRRASDTILTFAVKIVCTHWGAFGQMSCILVPAKVLTTDRFPAIGAIWLLTAAYCSSSAVI